jgi:hypothetical protein
MRFAKQLNLESPRGFPKKTFFKSGNMANHRKGLGANSSLGLAGRL